MAFDENPDEVFDNEPEAEVEGNGDEQSNRSFRMMMIGLAVIGGLGVLLIALIFISRQGDKAAIDAQNQMVQATNQAVAALAAITPTPLPTDTPVPTNTALPTNTPTAVPSPTNTPTQVSTTVVTGTEAITTTPGSASKATPAGNATAVAQAKGTTVATAKPAAGGQATIVPGSSSALAATATVAAAKGVTSTQPITGTTGTGAKGLPTTGAGDNLFVLLLAAVGLVGVLVVARRLRTSQG
jgi:cytoskeletal protein RodZ